MHSIKLFVLLSIPFILASCATLNKSECSNTDWQAIGVKDGLNGRDVNYLQNHREACVEHGAKPDVEKYQLGYKAGLARYCTAGKGYWLGESGQDFKDVCPLEFGDAYLKGYKKGHNLYLTLDGLD